MDMPNPKELKVYAIDALRVLLYSKEPGRSQDLEKLINTYRGDAARMEWLMRMVIGQSQKFVDAQAAQFDTTAVDYLKKMIEQFEKGSGWPLQEYLP